MCLQYLSMRFTNNSDHALVFQAHAGTEAEMAEKANFPESPTAGDRGGQGTF